jgi:hypothetical protein
MIRYLKVVLKGKEGNELYCTINSMRVYGQGMHVVMRNSLMELMHTENGGSLGDLDRKEIIGLQAAYLARSSSEGVLSLINADDLLASNRSSDTCQSTDLALIDGNNRVMSDSEVKLLKYLWDSYHQKSPMSGNTQLAPPMHIEPVSLPI